MSKIDSKAVLSLLKTMLFKIKLNQQSTRENNSKVYMVVVLFYVALEGKTSGILCHVLDGFYSMEAHGTIRRNYKAWLQKWCTQKKMRYVS